MTCSTQQKVSSVFRTKRLIFPTRTFLRIVRAAVLKVHDGVAERIDNACTKKKMPKSSSQTFKPNSFVSRTVNILKVPRVNLELWEALLDKVKSRDVGFQAFQKGLIKGIVSVANLASKFVEAKKNKAQFIPVSDAAYVWLLTR